MAGARAEPLTPPPQRQTSSFRRVNNPIRSLLQPLFAQHCSAAAFMLKRLFHLVVHAAISFVFTVRDHSRRSLQWWDNMASQVLSLCISIIYRLACRVDPHWTKGRWGTEASLQALFWTGLSLPLQVTSDPNCRDPSLLSEAGGSRTARTCISRNSWRPDSVVPHVRNAFDVTPQEIAVDEQFIQVPQEFDSVFSGSESELLPCLSEPSSAGPQIATANAVVADPYIAKLRISQLLDARLKRTSFSDTGHAVSDATLLPLTSMNQLARGKLYKQQRITIWMRRHKKRSIRMAPSIVLSGRRSTAACKTT